MKSVFVLQKRRKKMVMETKWFTQSHTGNYQRSQQFIPSHAKQSDVLFSMAETNPISPAALPLGLPDMVSNASSLPTGLRAFCSHSHCSYPSHRMWEAFGLLAVRLSTLSQKRRQDLESTLMACGHHWNYSLTTKTKINGHWYGSG